MNFMIAYFPAIRFAISIFALFLIYFSFRKGFKKTGYTIAIAIILFLVLSPLKYDGTKTKEYHQLSHRERSTQYNYISDHSEKKVTKKKTFAERMAEESARSKQQNQEIKDDILK